MPFDDDIPTSGTEADFADEDDGRGINLEALLATDDGPSSVAVVDNASDEAADAHSDSDTTNSSDSTPLVGTPLTPSALPTRAPSAAGSKDTKTAVVAELNVSYVHYQVSHEDFFVAAAKGHSLQWNHKRRNSSVSLGMAPLQQQRIICNGKNITRFFAIDAKQHPVKKIIVKNSATPITQADIELAKREVAFFNKAHPGKARLIYDEKAADTYRLVMEEMGEMNLGDAFKQATTLAEKFEILIAALEELQRLHTLGIIHRDFKWDNLRMAKIDGKWKAFAIDFEHACMKDDIITFADVLVSLEKHFGEMLKKTKESEIRDKPEHTLYVNETAVATEVGLYAKSEKFKGDLAALIQAELVRYTHWAPESLAKNSIKANFNLDVYAFCQMVFDLLPDLFTTNDPLQKNLNNGRNNIEPAKRPTIEALITAFQDALRLAQQPAAAPSPAPH